MVEPYNEDAAWEIIFRVDGSDVAISSGFTRIDGKVDVVMGVAESGIAPLVADMLEYSATLYRRARFSESWEPVHESGSNGNETSTLPF